MDFIRLDTSDSHKPFADKIAEWYLDWWGIRDGYAPEQIRERVFHSLNGGNRLPQTFGTIENGAIVGTVSVAMSDDLFTRADLYPWLANVYVDEKFRGRGVASFMLSKIGGVMDQIGLDEMYLYTKHAGLYEKFGWQFVEFVKTYRTESPRERLYVMRKR